MIKKTSEGTLCDVCKKRKATHTEKHVPMCDDCAHVETQLHRTVEAFETTDSQKGSK